MSDLTITFPTGAVPVLLGEQTSLAKLFADQAEANVDAATSAAIATAQAAATTATTQAGIATAAVAATRESFGVEIYNDGAAIVQGQYNGDYNASAAYTVNHFNVIIEDATVGATADVTVLVDGVAAYGPVTVTFGTPLSATPTFSIPSGADDAYLIERLTGTVRKMYVRADGVPS